MATELVVHRGGCHCGAVRYEVTAPADIAVSRCNCSICSKSGYLGLLVREDRFTLLCGTETLTAYRFNTSRATHLFCSTCGIKSFYHPRSHPDGINVNARCLDPETIRSLTINQIDGQNWESIYSDDAPAPFFNC